jgi:hypothetical protein
MEDFNLPEEWDKAQKAGHKFCQQLEQLFSGQAPDELAGNADKNLVAEAQYYSNTSNLSYQWTLKKINKQEDWVLELEPEKSKQQRGYVRVIKETGRGLPMTDLGGGVVPFLRSIPETGVRIPGKVTKPNGSVELVGDYDIVDVTGILPLRKGPDGPIPPNEPKPPAQEEYVQYMMRSQIGHNNGIVISNHIYKYGGTLSYSNALFYSWRAFNRPHFDAPAPTDTAPLEVGVAERVKALRFLVQFNIDNALSKEIIEKVYDTHPLPSRNPTSGSEIRREWKRKNGHDDAFYALLGTPNSKFVGYLLTQHFEDLRLDIKEIYTAREGDGKYYMCFVLRPRA